MQASNRLLLLLASSLLALQNCYVLGQTIQGEYPSIGALSTFRPVESTSVCGEGMPESYCAYTTDATASLLPNCMELQCNNTCPFSSASPVPLDLVTLSGSIGSGISATQGRPGSTSQALRFQNSSISIPAASVPTITSNGFSIASWVNQDQGNEGALVAKVSGDDGSEVNYAITVSSSSIRLTYLPRTSGSVVTSVAVNNLDLDHTYWHHIAVTVYENEAAIYVNGSVVGALALLGPIRDDASRDIKLGQIASTESAYNGLVQDIYYYTQALTVREVMEVVTGSLPFLHLSTECRCPPSHPQLTPQNQASCMQHDGGDFIPRGVVERLNPLSHPVGYINDLSRLFQWISAPGINSVNITVNLTNSLYEVFLVTIQFSSPRPKAALLETSRDGGLSFSPVQYFADDCMFYFDLPDDGPILAADDVNCVTSISSQLPTSSENIRFRFLNQATRNFNPDASPELRAFILASHLRLRLVDFFTEDTSTQHQYYAIQEIAVAARCACNGHASRCGTELEAICQCEHSTEGRNCETCLPTHSDKPWRYGTTNNGFPCKPCRCNGHASTCRYDVSVDPFPDSYEVGGGGVCLDCQDNTAGVNCDTCQFGFFRPSDRLPSDPSPCDPCECNPSGIADQGDCVKDQGTGGQIIGQCFCKANVIGLKCEVCRPGFATLNASNPDGCAPCNCNTAGTFNAMDTCDSDSAQCLCKDNVEGLKCDRCRAGTTSLSADNPLGCEGCSCDPVGSLSTTCDSVTGMCSCKPGVTGPRCDQCIPGFTGLSAVGCVPCFCDPSGSQSSICNAPSGQCPCVPGAVGMACDSCAPGFYNISAGCVSCGCDVTGSVNGSASCDVDDGQCDCKSNVQGRTCDACISGFTSLRESNPDGCSECDCFTPNTVSSGMICDPVTSRCDCVASATGMRCELCQDGFYLTSNGCTSCDCNLGGSSGPICNETTGACDCQSAGVTGRTCDSCFPGFFQFPSCTSCGCNITGSVEGTLCDSSTGVCSCKTYVTGAACDQCLPGFRNLEVDNPFGCSAPPDELAPPSLTPSPTSILLVWLPPEAPNGFIQSYNVFQNGAVIATVSELNFTSEGLDPDTEYAYFVEAVNSAGVTRSVSVTGRTLDGIPTGVLPPMLLAVSSSSILATWTVPSTPNGDIIRYELLRITRGTTGDIVGEVVEFSGSDFTAMVSNLMPFTLYEFLVRACTAGGCGSSEPAQVQTMQAPPTFQMQPNVTTLSSTSLLVEWEEPEEPNGVVVQYEVRQREQPFQGNGVFLGNVSNSTLSFAATGLQPFTVYEFSIVSYTTGGGTQSEWEDGNTAESVPSLVPPPTLLALSSSEIQLTWSPPQSPNGIIILYTVFQVSSQDGSDAVQVATSPQPGSSVVAGLLPFTEYFFVLEACTSQGCSRSQPSSAFTVEGAPSGQPAPLINETTPTSVTLTWDGPTDPNGVISSYSILRRAPSLSPSPLKRDLGVAFDGNVIKRFSPDDNSLGGITNIISFSFRTFSSRGTILYYINSAGTDYVAVELRNGVPWFFFDAGSGPAMIQPDLGGADVAFNNGSWHSVVATQTGRTGHLMVDGTYSGTGQSGGSDQVISSRQVLHVGGIPQGVPRSSLQGLGNPSATLEGRSYVGCLFGVTINNQALDFDRDSTDVGDASRIQDIPGCPIDLMPGWAFLGGGYLAFPETTLDSTSFSWSLDIRTTHREGVVFFVHDANGSAIALELIASVLHMLVVSTGAITNMLAIGDNSVCDGRWHSILLDLSQDEVFASVDGRGGSLFLPTRNTTFPSSVFIGGMPEDSMAYDVARGAGVNVYAPFSGCTRSRPDGLIVGGVTVSMLAPSSHRFVRFDGCPSPSSSPPDTCRDPWVNMSAGNSMQFTDMGLGPWTEYLYRVRAQNSVGFTVSSWIPAITGEAAPSGVGMVSLVTRTSSSLTTSWTTPTASNGLITRYEVIFSPVRTVGLTTPTGGSVTASLDVTEPEMVLLAVASVLQPATTYDVILTAFTIGGMGSGPTTQLTTEEAEPAGVQAPIVVGVGSRELTVTWAPPTAPNGIIVMYTLYTNGAVVFSGPDNATIVSGLLPFAEYTLTLEACTVIGCANSSHTINQTLPDAPADLAPPTLAVLGPSSIMATWQLPGDPNGVILRLELRMLLGFESAFEVVFNDVNLDLETTITGLAPNTLYTFQLVAFNAGGSVESPVVQARTLEDIPDDISPPSVNNVGATYLEVLWSPPGIPNGDIILYNLTLNGGVVFSTERDLSYNITDLQPFTSYSLSIIACTMRGCGSSNQSAVRTLEAVPTGYVPPTILSVSSSAIVLAVNPVSDENGVPNYVLYISGVFLLAGSADGVEAGQRVVHNGTAPSGPQSVGELVPFTNYSLFLEVVNSAGTLTGPSFSVQTLAAVPAGFLPPSLSLLDATTVLVEWDPPSLPNGQLLSYQVTRVTGTGAPPVTTSHGLATMATLTALAPFTSYLVSVSVTNTEGITTSDSTNITTGETAPAGFDRIVLLESGPRHLVVSWDPPAMPNGILVNYTVLLGDAVVIATLPTVLSYNVTELSPFTSYNLSVLACTSVDCVESPSLQATTQEDVPEGLSAPFVSASIGQPVLIAWTPPESPNGVILLYRVERSEQGGANLTTVGTLLGSTPSLVVGDPTTMPFTEYLYRVTAENTAGLVVSPFTAFLTLEAAPEGVLPPSLTAISPSTIQVSFSPPLRPQGNITMYTVSRSPPSPPSARTFSFTPDTLPQLSSEGTYMFNDMNLRPFTNYSYDLTVCTGSGCTVSDSSSEITLEDTPTGLAPPTAVTISSSEIMVEWAEPSMPNGAIQVYDVFRLSSGFDNETDALISCCEVHVENVTTLPSDCSLLTSSLEMDHLDTNLDPFSYYSYCLVVTNNAGSGFSDLSPLTRTMAASMPTVGPALNATTLNSTAVFLQWDELEVSELLGPLGGYTVYGKVSGTPGLGEVLFQGVEQSFAATDLLASTEYVFVVAVSNGEGIALGNNATATTEEGIPFDLPAPEVTAVRSDALSLVLQEPRQPNGQIILYTIVLDSRSVLNVSRPDTLLLGGLLPFTLYTVQVVACTRFGCTRSPLVAAMTLESAPMGLGSPFVTVTGPNSVFITWTAPNQPNGNITQYSVIQTQGPSGDPMVVFMDLAFQFSTSDLDPFTMYSFQVVAENGAGNVTSIPTVVTTLHGLPSMFGEPSATVISATEIAISWNPPLELNGELFGYQVYRDGEPLLSELTSALTFVERGLSPFTEYSYFVEICASGGCLNSSSVSNMTFEALLEMASDLVASNVQARSLVLAWEEPGLPNGEITEYIVTLLDTSTEVFRGLNLTTTLPDLIPFTDYSFQLMTCNSIGCVASNVTRVRTSEADPEGLDAPVLRNLTSTSVAIRWTAPAQPNGLIATYVLRRGDASFPDNSTIIFQGLEFSFNDLTLLADTLYFYTVEAVNGEGSFMSSPSFFRTVPDLAEDIEPPVLVVRGATEIAVTWSPPGRPNGEISAYMLYMDDEVVFTSLTLSYVATNLVPFTSYMFFVEVCNQAGCASSIAVSATTEQALAAGVTPPTLTVLSPTAVRVSWAPPTQPNGNISQYQIRRRILNMPLTESIQQFISNPGPDDELSFPNSALTPFTSYEYRLRVTNGAGSVLSEWVMVQTSEDIPTGLSLPMFSDGAIAARNVTATWAMPTSLNGIILRYVLEYRLAIDPVTFGPGEIVTALEVPANVTVAMATGLSPVTEYEFRVVAINSAGRGVGPFEVVLTREDIPEGVQPIVVEQRTGSTLLLTWSPPLVPHGVVSEYRILLDGATVYRDSALTYTVPRLQPFTSYSIQLAACTSIGCAFGRVQSATTAEVSPAGLIPPSLANLAGTTVRVSWSPPAQPNGIITRYEVSRRLVTDPPATDPPAVAEVVFSSSDASNLAYTDDSVRPATSYEYSVSASNMAGRMESSFARITTPEAAPEGLTPPSVTPVNASTIQVSWLPPSWPNGVIISYQVFRMGGGSGLQNMSAFSTSDAAVRSFSDGNLMPFTAYSYTLQACTAADCSLSTPGITTTGEATPTDLRPPTLTALSETSISIAWEGPGSPNGIVTRYTLVILPPQINVVVVVQETTELSRTISNLLPFTNYTVGLEACNSAGCISSNNVVTTLESIPQFTSPPVAAVVNSTALRVTWAEPAIPNGVIILYELRRNGTLVYSNSERSFVDAQLSPNTFYSYMLRAFTAAGAGDMSAVSDAVSTPPDTPEGVTPPSLQATSSTSITAMWVEPAMPNGEIQRYVLLLDGISAFEGIAFQFNVNGLSAFTSYRFQLMVCTTTCATSATANITTLEATPTGQAPPTVLEIVGNTQIVEIAWFPPPMPNGIITRYELERRQTSSQATPTEFVSVFSGPGLSYIDNDPSLRPTTSHEYRVTSFNSVGSSTSDAMSVTLSEAVPVGVATPTSTGITSTSIVVVVARPPDTPNGVIANYSLLVNDTRVQTIPSMETEFTVTGLRFFTEYHFVIEACTSGGCGVSEGVTLKTGEATPTELSAPAATATSPREIQISWRAPEQPNGIIISYSLWYRRACPQPPQQNIAVPDCVLGPEVTLADNISEVSFRWVGSGSDDPLPYSSYEFFVGAANTVGAVNSTSSFDIQTPISDPEVIGTLVLEKNFTNEVVRLDWSSTFRLNGMLQHYDLSRNGILLRRNPMTSISLPREPTGIDLTYVVTAVTAADRIPASATVTTRIDGFSTQPVTMTMGLVTDTLPTSISTEETPFHQKPAFIIGMVVLAALLVFVAFTVLLCCVRPKREKGLQLSRSFHLEADRTPSKKDYSKLSESSPKREPVTGSWSPGDPYTKGEIPDIDHPSDIFPMTTPTSPKSYSPSKAEMEHNRLSDIHITSPKHEVSARDDFGSFKHQQTTFEDTRV